MGRRKRNEKDSCWSGTADSSHLSPSGIPFSFALIAKRVDTDPGCENRYDFRNAGPTEWRRPARVPVLGGTPFAPNETSAKEARLNTEGTEDRTEGTDVGPAASESADGNRARWQATSGTIGGHTLIAGLPSPLPAREA